MTGPADYFALGDWNILCAQCGRKLKASQAVKNWQGTWRCPEHNEARHPQDFVRALRNEGQAAPFVQRPADIDARFCTVQTKRGIAGIGEAGCAVPLGATGRIANLIGVAGTGQFAQTVSTTAIQTAAAPTQGVQALGQTSSNLSITGVANPVVNPGTVRGTGAAGSLTTTLDGGQVVTGVLATGGISAVTASGELNIFANLTGAQATGRIPSGPPALNPGGPYAKQGYTFTVGANASPASSATKYGFDSRSPVFGSIGADKFFAGAEIKALYTDYSNPSAPRTKLVLAGTLDRSVFGTIINYRFTGSGFGGSNSRPSTIDLFTQTGTETIWDFAAIPGFEDYQLGNVGFSGYVRLFNPRLSVLTGQPDPPPP